MSSIGSGFQLGTANLDLTVDLNEATLSTVLQQTEKIEALDQEIDVLEQEIKNEVIGDMGTTRDTVTDPDTGEETETVTKHSVQDNFKNLYHMLTGIAVATGQEEIAGPLIALEGLYDEANHLYEEGHSVYDAIRNFKDLVGHPYNNDTVQAIDDDGSLRFDVDGTTPIYQEILPTGLHKRAYDLEQIVYTSENPIEAQKTITLAQETIQAMVSSIVMQLILGYDQNLGIDQHDWTKLTNLNIKNSGDGEIRFVTKDAYKYSDHNFSYPGFNTFEVNYYSGSSYGDPIPKHPSRPEWSEEQQQTIQVPNQLDHMVKIGKEGRLWFYHNHYAWNIFFPLINMNPDTLGLSGWYELDSTVNSLCFNIVLNQIQINRLQAQMAGVLASESVESVVETAETGGGTFLDGIRTFIGASSGFLQTTSAIVAGIVAGTIAGTGNRGTQTKIRQIDQQINAYYFEVMKIDKELENISEGNDREDVNKPYHKYDADTLTEAKTEFENEINRLKLIKLEEEVILYKNVGFLHKDYLTASDFELEEQTSTDVDGNTVVSYKLKSQKLTDIITTVGNAETDTAPSTGLYSYIDNIDSKIEDVETDIGNEEVKDANGNITKEGSGLKYKVQKLEEIVGDDTSGGSTLVSKISTIETDIGNEEVKDADGNITEEGSGLKYQVQKLEEIVGDDTGTGTTLLTRVTNLETEIDMTDISTTRIDQLDEKVNAMREITGYDDSSLLYLLLPKKPDGTTYTISDNEKENNALIDLGYKGKALKENFDDFFDIYVMPHYSVSQAISSTNKYLVKDLVSGREIYSYENLEIIEKPDEYISTIKGKMKYNDIAFLNFYISMFIKLPSSTSYYQIFDLNGIDVKIRQGSFQVEYIKNSIAELLHLDESFTDNLLLQVVYLHGGSFKKYTNQSTVGDSSPTYPNTAFYIRQGSPDTALHRNFFVDNYHARPIDGSIDINSYELRPFISISGDYDRGDYMIYQADTSYILTQFKINISKDWSFNSFTGGAYVSIRFDIYASNQLHSNKGAWGVAKYSQIIGLANRDTQSLNNTHNITWNNTTSYQYYMFAYEYCDSSGNTVNDYISDDYKIRFNTFQITNNKVMPYFTTHQNSVSYSIPTIDYNDFNHLVVNANGDTFNFYLNGNQTTLQLSGTPHRTSENVLSIGDQYEYRGAGVKGGILDTANIEPISELSKTNYRVRIKELAVMDEVYVTESLILENPIQYRNTATGGTRRLAEQEDTSGTSIRRRLALEDETTSTPSTFVYLDEILLRDTVPTQNKIVIYDHTTSSFSITDDNLYQRTADAFSGNYDKLTNKPTLFDGAYSSLSGKPTLFDGNYNNLTNKPTLFDGNYSSLNGKPTLFDGNYSSLNGKPTLFDGNYNNLTNKPTLFDGAYSSLSGIPTLFDGNYNNLTNKPTLFDGAYSSLSGIPTLFDGNYNNLTNKPTLFDGNYNNLTNLPTLSDYQLQADASANYYNKTEIDHKILGGIADSDISSKNMTGIVKHIYNDVDDHFLMVSQNLYPSEIVGLQEFMYNAITIESVENQFPVLQTFTADSFLELATDQKVLYITLTQYEPLTIEYQYGTGSVITHTYTTFTQLGWPMWLNINISQNDYIAFRITAPFEFRLRFEREWLDPDPIYATSTSTSYTSPQQITQENGSLYLHHDNGDGTSGYHRIISFILDPPRYQNKFKSAVIPPDTTKIDYMNFINSGGTHYLRIGRNQVYSDINLDVNLGWLAGANHNHDTVYAHINHNHDGVYLKTVEDVFAFMDRSKFELNDHDNRINLKGNLSYFTESSSSGIGTATTTLSYNGNIHITGELDCVNVTVDSLTFRDNSYITSATGLGGGGGGGGVVNYTDIQVPTITETVPGNLITVDVIPTVAPNHYYIDQSPVTEYTVLQTDATNLKAWYKFDNSSSLFENSAPSSANPISLTFTSRTSTNNDGVYSTTDSIIGGSFYKSDPAAARGYDITPSNWLATNFNTSKQATFAFWVKNTESSNAVSHIFRQERSFIIRQYGATGFQVYIAPDNWSSYDNVSSDVLTYNTWVHIAVVINLTSGTNDNDVVKIYKNGVELATTVSNSYSMIGVGFQNDESVSIFAGGYDGFKGYLDDFRIYDKALTADEISLLYNKKVLVNIEPQDIPGTTDYKTLTFTYDATRYPEIDADATNLKAWYKFDGNFTDSSGNNDLVNISGFTSYQFDNDSIVGQSSFTPADTANMIQTNNTNFSSMTECSISLWIKFTGDRSTEYDVVYHVDYNRNAVFHRLYDTPGSSSSGNSNARIMLLCNYNWDVGSGFITEDVWTHYCITAKKNGTYTDMKVYKNGVLFNSLLGTATFENTNSKIRFGFDSTSYVFQGYLDDFRVYDKELTADEINTLYSVNQTSYDLTFDNPAECDILIVGGGGAGGHREHSSSNGGGGGGAGGLQLLQNITLSGAVNIKVGRGGIGNSLVERGENGYDSSVIGTGINYISIGGGGGGTRVYNGPDDPIGIPDIAKGGDGGSGGGSCFKDSNGANSFEGGSGTSGQGNDGGKAFSPGKSGGGGGAGERGGGINGVEHNNGGDGLYSKNSINFKTHFNINDTSIGHHINNEVYFSGGGGGGEQGDAENQGQGGLGGAGGGGDSANGDNALSNTGGGGGGASNVSTSYSGGNGGSGIVIIRYKTTYTTGSPPVTTQITPRGVLKYNTNDEWSLSTISQTDIADLEQNSIIVSLLNEISLLKSRVAVLESSGGGSVGNSVTFTFVYKFEYGIETVLTDGMLLTINNTRAKYKPNITLKLLDPIVGTNTYTYSVSKNESGTRTVIKTEPFSSLPVDTLTNSEILTNVTQGTSPLMYFDIIENGTSMLISEFYCTINRENDIPLSATINISTSQIDIDVGLGEITTLTQVPRATIPATEEQTIVLTLKDINLHIPDATANSQYELYMYNEIYTQWDLSKGVADLVNIDAGVYLFDIFNNGSSQYRIFAIKKTTENSIVLSNTARQIRINY